MPAETVATAVRGLPSPVVVPPPSTIPPSVNRAQSPVTPIQTMAPTNNTSLHTATPAASTPAPKALTPSPLPTQSNSSSFLLPVSTPLPVIMSKPEPTASATASPSSEANHRVPAEAIAAAVIGSCLFLALALGFVRYLMKRSARKMRDPSGLPKSELSDSFSAMAQSSTLQTNPRNQEAGGIGASPAARMSRSSSISSVFSASSHLRSEKLPSRAPSVNEGIYFHHNPHVTHAHGALFQDAEYVNFPELDSDFRGWDGSRPNLPLQSSKPESKWSL